MNPSGYIEECFPGYSREEALSLVTRFSSMNIDKKRYGPFEFIDLTESTMTGENENLCLSPGLIDVHTHISALGRNWEGYSTATAAAAAGGITTIIGMPLNSIPPTVSIDEVEQELECANSESTDLHVDVGLWGGVLPETASQKQQISDLLSHPNVLGLKVFLSPLPAGAGYQAISPTQLLDVAKLCGTFEKPILVHSELMTAEQQQDVMATVYPDDGSLDDSHDSHVKSRPTKWEQDAVKVVIEASRYCHMHVVHLSDGIGCLPLIAEAKKRKMGIGNTTSSEEKNKQQLQQNGSVVTVETCPHYLLFDSDQISESIELQNDRRLKCFPPIRGPDQRRRLWKGLVDGEINMVASDHSPCEPSMRHDVSSMKTAWGGLTGLQYQLPATWSAAKIFETEVHRSGGNACSSYTITENDMAKWWSTNPAQLAGLDDDRGSIEAGKRADFVLWNTDYGGPPDAYCKEYHRWKGDSIYSSQKALRGRVLGTWLKGERIYDGIQDKMLQKNKGQYIKRGVSGVRRMTTSTSRINSQPKPPLSYRGQASIKKQHLRVTMKKQHHRNYESSFQLFIHGYHQVQQQIVRSASSSSSGSNGAADIKMPTPALKSWESGARRVQNVNGENSTYMDHIRDMHDPSRHIKTIEDELKGTIGKALGKQAEKILVSIRCMDQEHKRYMELLDLHNANSSSGNDTDHPDIRKCAEAYNEYRKEAIHRRWELIVHRQAVGFIVGNHQFVMEKFPIPEALPVDSSATSDNNGSNNVKDSTKQRKSEPKKFGDQLDWWQKIGRWR